MSDNSKNKIYKGIGLDSRYYNNYLLYNFKYLYKKFFRYMEK